MRKSFRKELREYEAHCRMLSTQSDAQLRRVQHGYYLTRARKLRQKAAELISQAEEAEANHAAMYSNQEALKKEAKRWLRYAAICKMILSMPSQAAKPFLLLPPKDAVRFFILTMQGKEEEAVRLIQSVPKKPVKDE